MTSFSRFQRDASGAYASIHQEIDPRDIPEESTFVAFDAVRFASMTGQAALLAAVEYDLSIPGGTYVMIDNSDER